MLIILLITLTLGSLGQQAAQQLPVDEQAAIRAETIALVFRDHIEITTRGRAEDEYLRLLQRRAVPDRYRLDALQTALSVHPDACVHYLCPDNSTALIAPWPEFRRKE